MAELGGMLAAAILKVVGEQIGSAIGGQIALQMNFDKELKKMKKALQSVEAVLKVAERRNVTDEPTCLWLKELKDFMYVISDMIDESEADTQAITQPSERMSSFKKYLAVMIPCCFKIGPKITMANEMAKMREELEAITKRHKDFKLPEGTVVNEPKVIDIRETAATLETHIIERTEETMKILASLSGNMTKDITILPICGIGGLGKTTLAKMVYYSSQFKEYSQVWVYVSRTFDLNKIGNSIISQLSEKRKERKYTEMQMIHKSLQELLVDKKILIVLDDLWETNISQLDKLKDMLKVGKANSVVVIVTTRNEDIAKEICTIGIQPHKLAPLTHDQCWAIIKQKCDFQSRGDKEQLGEIGKAIAMKCVGVALAAKSLGHTLRSMKSGQLWESVRDSNIWSASSLTDAPSTQVFASLKLSYRFMSPYLKLCFAYCAIFPKGHKILKDDLLHQWVSLGFSTREVSERYISELLGLSFLEHLKSSSIMETYDDDTTILTMHDLVHDLAISVMDDEILVIAKGSNTIESCYHYALLDDCSKPLGSESSKIRALRFMNCDKINLHDAAFSSAKSLRVLDLSECTIQKLPDCIDELRQLRYLNAPRVQDAKIPDNMTKLSKLIYLNLHGSPKIVALPELIGDIKGLAYLDLSGCLRIAKLPESIGEIEGLLYLDLSGCLVIEKLPESFGRLKQLMHLDLSNCSCVGGISVFLGSLRQLQYLNLSYCQNIGEMPEALGGLTKLQYLNLSFNSYLQRCQEAEFLGVLTKLEYLNLSSRRCSLQKLPEAPGGFIQLKYLNLSGCWQLTKLPRLFGSLNFLVHLDLSYCPGFDHQHEASLVGLTNLQYLNLTNARISTLPEDLIKLRYLNLSKRDSVYLERSTRYGYSPYFGSRDFNSLINHIGINHSELEHLDLSGNISIGSIPTSLCDLKRLHALDLSGCKLLTKIPESIHTIGSLKFLNLEGCNRLSTIPQLSGNTLSLPYFGVCAGDDKSSSNLGLLQPTDPVELQITELENVKYSVEAQHIKLMEKESLEDLKLKWSRGAERSVEDKMLLEKLVPPRTLKKLEICGYNSVSFPAWLVGQLPNLESLVLRDMPNMEEWSTSYSSGEEHVIEELEIDNCPMLRIKVPLPKAKSWKITCSDNVLSSQEECTLPHTSASSSSPVTTSLSVIDCKVSLHQWRLLQHFPGLPSLFIENCGDLTSSPEITQHLSSLERLVLEHAHMEELPEWLGDLSSLQELRIAMSNGVKEFNENRRQLTMLQSLRLFMCPSLSLPHWLGELTSLSKLWVNGSNVLRSLPESIQQLTNLQELVIRNCHKLEHVVVESKERKMRLTRNQNRLCVLPTSLKDLHISGCEGIKCLPVGIQQLTNLQDLCIIACPELEQWCELEENKMKLAHIENKEIR